MAKELPRKRLFTMLREKPIGSEEVPEISEIFKDHGINIDPDTEGLVAEYGGRQVVIYGEKGNPGDWVQALTATYDLSQMGFAKAPFRNFVAAEVGDRLPGRGYRA